MSDDKGPMHEVPKEPLEIRRGLPYVTDEEEWTIYLRPSLEDSDDGKSADDPRTSDVHP